MSETEKEARIMAAVGVGRSEDCPQPFALHRGEDVTGVSGTGTVAHGVLFADGTVAIRWAGEHASTVIWGSLADAMHVHGHDGRTRVVWLMAPFSEMAQAEQEAAGQAGAVLEQLRADLGAVLPYVSFSCAPLGAVQRLFDAARSEMEEQT